VIANWKTPPDVERGSTVIAGVAPVAPPHHHQTWRVALSPFFAGTRVEQIAISFWHGVVLTLRGRLLLHKLPHTLRALIYTFSSILLAVGAFSAMTNITMDVDCT